MKTDDKLILFVSFMGMNFNDSPRKIYDYLQKHEQYRDYRCVWTFEHPEKYPELDTVKIDSLRYFKTALKAKYWITNTNIERGLKFKKKSQIYLNTWHGIALKTIGNDCPGRKDYNFDTVDYLVVSGEHDEKVFKSAFCAKESTFLRCGMPRNEKLWTVSELEKNKIKEEFGIPENKKVILYAPTWRESCDGGKTYSLNIPIDFKKWKEALGEDYIVFLRAHHQTNKVLGVEFDDFVRDMSEYPELNDLLIVADILVSDYSSISFDYSILGKPILIYAYDYDTYLSSRCTYFDIDEKFPNKSCRTEEELLDRLTTLDYSNECKNTLNFRNQFFKYRGNSTETCVNKVFEGQ